MSIEEFKRSKEAEAAAAESAESAESGPAFYALDKNRMPHFGLNEEEALAKARAANEGYQ